MKPVKKGYHRHHIIPRHAGGNDNDDNIIYLTPEEHAKAHLALYEKYHRYEDAQAYNSLKKYWLGGRRVRGYKQSKEHIAKRIASMDYSQISLKTKGCIGHTLGIKFGPPSEETRRKISESQKGKIVSISTRIKMSNSLKGRKCPNKIECYCIWCRKRVPPSRFDRHGPGKKACTK